MEEFQAFVGESFGVAEAPSRTSGQEGFLFLLPGVSLLWKVAEYSKNKCELK